MAGKFELYKDKSNQYRFRLKAGNGENIGASEAYTTKAAAQKGIESVKKNATEDGQYEYKEGKNGKIYFNLKAKNHQVILSSQGYASESGAKAGAKSVAKAAPDAKVTDL